MLTLVSFLFAISLLVAVHEWGHFAMARACGVKVLQFSIGFGPRIAGWTSRQSGTEYRLSLLPLGGFVKMLDEREAAVDPSEWGFTFNRKPLLSRAAVVAAGPLANLVLALILYSSVNWLGVSEPEPLVSRPPAQSIAAKAGFSGGERILAAGYGGETLAEVHSFEDFRWWLTRAALNGRDLQLAFQRPGTGTLQSVELSFDGLDVSHADASMFQSIGFIAPLSKARIGNVSANSPAQLAGLQFGDLVLQVDTQRIADSAQLRDLIRSSGAGKIPSSQNWLLQRGDVQLEVVVTPRQEHDAQQTIGRIGAMIGEAPAMVTVQYSFLQGMQRAVEKTWEVSALTLRMMGQIVTGAASVRNLSGPITIADYAGQSAAMGVEQFMVFLALISISLGVLNLLPLPVLDGGHLMYYGWEALTGRAVSEAWLNRLQRVGFAILLVMMSIAMLNDLHRLLN